MRYRVDPEAPSVASTRSPARPKLTRMTIGIITPEDMYAAEREAFAAGLESFEAMRRAGTAVAEELNAHLPDGPVQVLCGPGGNGGDGFVAAAHLKNAGRTVEVYLLGDADRLSGDPARAAALWDGPIHALAEARLAPGHVTLDALFGGGLSRPLEGVAARLSAMPAPVVSVDVPSGLDGLSAKPLGPCFKADLTVTFSAYRPAHMLSPGRAMCGKVCVSEIGIPVTPTVWENDPALWQTPAEPSVDRKPREIEVLSGEAFEKRFSELAASAGNRIEAVLKAARASGKILVLQDAETLVSSPEGRCAVDPAACAAAKLGPTLRTDDAARLPAFEAACCAVWNSHQAR